MTPCPHCGADVGDASPAYCPVCRGPLLGQRTRDVAAPPPNVEFDRSHPYATSPTRDEDPVFSPPMPAGPPESARKGLRTALRLGALALIVGPTAWGLIDRAVNSAERDDTGVVVGQGDMAVTDLQVGDCFDFADAGDDYVEEVRAVPCSEPHANETYVVTNYPGGKDYPGEPAIFEWADQSCLSAFSAYVGKAYEDSALEFGYFYPDADGWEQGDHGITCVLYDVGGSRLTGSVRDSGR